MGSQLQGTRLLHQAFAAESKRLLDENPRVIELGRLRTGLLQLEILDGSAQAPELRERALGNELGYYIAFGAFPEPQAQVKSRSSRETSLGSGEQRIDTAVQVR